MKKKTDNASLASKVAIRRWLLERLDITEVRVLETCTGLGKIWSAMEEHVTIRQWTRCDIKPRRAGVLALDATKALQKFPLDVYNVIDIDPYGEPWEPYRVLLQRLTRPTAVFLTYGHVAQAMVSNSNVHAVGIPEGWPIPRTPSLSAFIGRQQLEATWLYANISIAGVCEPSRNVTYYALGLEPK